MKYKWPILFGLLFVILALIAAVVVIDEIIRPFEKGSNADTALLCSIPILLFFLFAILSTMVGIFLYSLFKNSIGIYGACRICGTSLERIFKDGYPILMCKKCGDLPPLDDIKREALLISWEHERDYIIMMKVMCKQCGNASTLKGMRPMWIQCETCGGTILVPPPTPTPDISASDFRF
jgi:hypothetical protein